MNEIYDGLSKASKILGRISWLLFQIGLGLLALGWLFGHFDEIVTFVTGGGKL